MDLVNFKVIRKMQKNKILMLACLISVGLFGGCSESAENEKKSVNSEKESPKTAVQTPAVIPPKEPQVAPPSTYPNPADTDAQKPAGKLVFSQTTHEFGTVWEGDKARHIFHFVNEGPGDLVIHQVKPSCGCTAEKTMILDGDEEKPYELGKALAPGAKGYIEAILNTAGVQGHKASAVNVHSSDAQNPNQRLSLAAEVEKLLQLEPQAVSFGGFVGKEGAERSVTLKALKHDSLSVVGWDELPEFIELQAQPIEGKPNEVTVIVRMKPGMPEGIVSQRLMVKVQLPGMDPPRDLVLPISGSVLPTLVIEPKTASFAMVELGSAKTVKVQISNRDEDKTVLLKSFRLESQQKDIETLVSGEMKTEVEGKEYAVELTVHENAPRGVFRGNLILQLEEDGVPIEKMVPFTGVVRLPAAKK